MSGIKNDFFNLIDMANIHIDQLEDYVTQNREENKELWAQYCADNGVRTVVNHDDNCYQAEILNDSDLMEGYIEYAFEEAIKNMQEGK